MRNKQTKQTTMTAREKEVKFRAKMLVQRYEMQAVLADLNYTEQDSVNMALIAVDEIIGALQQVKRSESLTDQIFFWLDVRTELNTKLLNK